MKFACLPPSAGRAFVTGALLTISVLPGAGTAAPRNLPAFNLPDLEGRVHSSSEFEGRVLVLDFWATWCATCRQVAPKLAELQRKHGGRGLIVVGVSVDKAPTRKKIGTAARKSGIDYLVLHDRENTLAPAFGFTAIPSVYVFDRQGGVVAAMAEFNPDRESELTEAVEKALNGPPRITELSRADKQAQAKVDIRKKGLPPRPPKARTGEKSLSRRKGKKE